MTARLAFTAAGTAIVAACVISMHAPAAHRELTIRYTTQQPTCAAAQLGERARIVGGGNDFQAVCRRNGPINTWDAR